MALVTMNLDESEYRTESQNNKMNTIIRTFHFALGLGCLLLIFSSGCKKETTATAVPETGTMSDLEGNVYRTVKIGDL
jgi:hypothetical protein